MRVSACRVVEPFTEVKVTVAVDRSELPSKGLVHVSWKLVVVTPVTVKPVGV